MFLGFESQVSDARAFVAEAFGGKQSRDGEGMSSRWIEEESL